MIAAQNRLTSSRPGPRSSWATPTRLAAAFVAVVLAAGILFWATVAGIGSARSSLRTIGHQTAPQIVAAQGIYFSLSDMDAQVANYLLVGKRNLGSTEADAINAYNQDATVATRELVAAAANAAGSAERDLIQSTLSAAIAYQALASHAEILADQGDTTGALVQYRQATDLMHGTLLPAATRINDLNLQSLNAAYTAQKAHSTRGVLVVVAAGVLLLAVLAATQWYVFRRTRRILNPGLVGATLVALALIGGGILALTTARHDLKGAKQDGFDSVVALTTARAVAYEANADESRYLIDPVRAAQYQDAFLAKSLKVVGLPGPVTIGSFDGAMAAAVTDAEAGKVDFGGYLGTELNNITFPGERQAALDTLAAYQVYQQDDRKLRQLATSGQSDAAITFDTSTAPGQSNYHFYQFDNALQKVIGINERYLASYTKAGDLNLSPWGILPVIALVGIVALALAGLWPRFNEYR